MPCFSLIIIRISKLLFWDRNAVQKTTFVRDHISYKLDNSLWKGTGTIILWLVLILTIIVLKMSLFVWFTGTSPEPSLKDQVWSFYRSVLKYLNVTEDFLFNISIFVLFITSFFVSRGLIGALTTGLAQS